jgi:hypothetical protein
MTPIRVADLEVDVVERSDVDADFTAVFLHAAHVDHWMAQAAFEPVLAARARWRRLYLDLPWRGHPARLQSVCASLSIDDCRWWSLLVVGRPLHA